MSYWTGLFVPDKYVARLVPAGGADAFVLGLFAWALMGFANIYYGMAQRAIDLAVPEVKKKTSVAVSRNVAYHPELQHSIAEMMLAFDPIGPHLDSVAEDWSAGVDHGLPGRQSWFRQSTTRSTPVGGSWTRRWKFPAARGYSGPTPWSGCSGMRVVAASTRRIPS